jgi:hypothetical protein
MENTSDIIDQVEQAEQPIHTAQVAFDQRLINLKKKYLIQVITAASNAQQQQTQAAMDAHAQQTQAAIATQVLAQPNSPTNRKLRNLSVLPSLPPFLATIAIRPLMKINRTLTLFSTPKKSRQGSLISLVTMRSLATKIKTRM